METIGDKIRMQRLIKNYSQEYMAFMLGISQPAYSKIERNETEIRLKRVYEIADVLGVDPFTLMPPSKYSIGINYLWLKQLYHKFYKLRNSVLLKKKLEAERLNFVNSDKSNSLK